MPNVKKSSPKKDSNGGKLGQFTTEVHKTKLAYWLKGFKTISWFVFLFGVFIGFILGRMAGLCQ